MSDEKISQLQSMEQSLQNLLVQKQKVQSQLLEIESAIDEMGTSETVYKIIGNIMIKKKRSDLETDMKERAERMNVRMSTLEKQEDSIKQKVKTLQEEVMESMKK